MVELADIVRRAGPEYVHAHAGGLLASQRRALDDIAQCRTAAMGGSVSRCDTCGAVRYHYHSCRNRHCPKCQEDRAQDWLARIQARLLPCDHYLLTLTLPHQLRAVARRHQRVVYAALLREAAASVQTLAADRQWVGGMLGILAVLHIVVYFDSHVLRRLVMRTYTAIIERDPDTGVYVGSVPGFPGAHSQGDTLDELQANLQEVIAMLLEDGEKPLEAEFVGTQTIRVAQDVGSIPVF